MDIHIQLVKDLKNGSYEAFNKLYEIYADVLYIFVLNLTKSHVEAKDILQETFMRIWKNRDNISLEYSFKAFLYKIARNLIIDSFRKQMDSVAFQDYICSDEYQQNVENNTEQEIYFEDFYKSLQQAKQKLTVKQKEIFELSREQGLSISQIAQQLNLSEQTVKNQLTIALKILRSRLAKHASVFFLFL